MIGVDPLAYELIANGQCDFCFIGSGVFLPVTRKIRLPWADLSPASLFIGGAYELRV